MPPTPSLTRWLAPGEDRRLLVVGGASLDILHVAGRPTPAPGGAGFYTALAAARAGADVTMLAHRPDPMPDSLVPALDIVTWVGPTVTPEQLPRFEIGYDDDGHVRIFNEAVGAEHDLTPELLDVVAPLPPVAYCVPFLDAALQLRFVHALAERGCLTVGSTYATSAVEETDRVLETAAAADLMFCNQDEAGALFGGVDQAAPAPGQLRFITLGADGAVVFQGDHKTEVTAPAVEVIDPTGAGDTFCGTTLARLVSGDHPVVAARAGARAASEEVTGVGPATLFGPPSTPAPDRRLAVDHDRVDAIAHLIAGLTTLQPFPFVGDTLPDVDEPGAIDFFFTATLQQFGFWYEHDGRYHEPVVATIDGHARKGSDFLWAAYLRWLRADPDGLTPAAQTELSDAEFTARLAADDGHSPLPEPWRYADCARAYGRTMLAVEQTPTALIAAANAAARPVAALLRTLDHVGGYREDPLRKKSALLAVILRARPEAWLRTAPGDDAPPIVDYHVQRTALRTGMVDITDPSLRERVEQRLLLTADEEEAIRTATAEAVDALVAASGRSMEAADWFLFQMRHQCPEMTEPQCDTCPAEPGCARRTELFQPVLRTTFY